MIVCVREENYLQDLLKILSLKKRFNIYGKNPDKSLIGGESNQEALMRILDLLQDLEERYSDKTIFTEFSWKFARNLNQSF